MGVMASSRRRQDDDTASDDTASDDTASLAFSCVETFTQSNPCKRLALPGRRIVTTRGYGISVWDAAGRLQTLAGHGHHCICVVALEDGRIISGGGSLDCRLKLWDLEDDGRCVATLSGHADTVRDIAELPSGYVVSCSSNGDMMNPCGILKLWDLDQERCIDTVEDLDSDCVVCVAALLDGRVAAGGTHSLQIWEVTDWNVLRLTQTIDGHATTIQCVSAVGDRVLTGSYDHTAKLWDPNDGSCLLTLSHSDKVLGLTVLPDGRIGTGSEDGQINLWSQNDGRCLDTWTGHEGRVWDLAIINGHIVSAGHDGKVKIWQDMRRLAEKRMTKALARQRLNGDVAKTICMYL